MNLSKGLENLIRNNVKFDETAPWSYVVYQSKYLAHGEESLMKKCEKIKRFAEKNNGYCKVMSDIYITGDNKAVKIEMNCDCVAAKAFDAVVEEKEHPFIYISMDANRVWSASTSANRLSQNAVRFCEEKDYPVSLIYVRTDINGSSVFEKVVCTNQIELFGTLNWLGKCGFTPLELWDFDIDSSNNERLLKIFDSACEHRMESVVREAQKLDVMISDAESKHNVVCSDKDFIKDNTLGDR